MKGEDATKGEGAGADAVKGEGIGAGAGVDAVKGEDAKKGEGVVNPFGIPGAKASTFCLAKEEEVAGEEVATKGDAGFSVKGTVA